MSWASLARLAFGALEPPDPSSMLERAKAAERRARAAAEAVVLAGLLLVPSREALQEATR